MLRNNSAHLGSEEEMEHVIKQSSVSLVSYEMAKWNGNNTYEGMCFCYIHGEEFPPQNTL